MFKLRRLEISGFKSFADYTEIVFTGNGITAVVGPNGCGKSNVSDAISWVLGEQSPKSLRGQDMKDVVFQGTGKRKPGGMAEVVLHLERDGEYSHSDESELEDIDARLGELDANAVDVDALEAEHLVEPEDEDQAVGEIVEIGDIQEENLVQAAQAGSAQAITARAKRRWRPRSFALDFAPGEAVSVTRRLYLSGESEYLLNDKTCRLRDIQDLFAGTGLSGSHYAIIEQGKIGRILSSKPSDRRGLIEEAAGISKFKTRQRAAESRLESAKINLGRISDIVEEIETRTRSLRRQANKTKRYKVLKDELRDLQGKTYTAESARLRESVAELADLLAKSREEETQLKLQVEQKESLLRAATEGARAAEEALTKLRASHADNALERDRAERERRYQDEQRLELSKRILDLQDEGKVTRARIEDLVLEIETTKTAAAKETGFARDEKAKLEKAEAAYRLVLTGVKETESRLDAERADHLQHTAAGERLSEIGRQFENDLERNKERVKGLETERSRAEETLKSRKKESVDINKELDQERRKLEASRVEKQEASEQCVRAREALAAADKESAAAEQEFARTTHRLETLKELEQTGAIYEPSVQKLMASGKDLGVKLLGTLADRFKTEGSAEDAVEAMFGPYLQTVLVESKKDAVKVVKYLNQKGLGRIPILVAGKNTSNGAKPNPDIVRLLGIESDFAALLAAVFPNVMAAQIAKDVDTANGDAPMVVTNEGDLIFGGRLFVSGRKSSSAARNTSLLAFKREMRDLDKALVQLKQASVAAGNNTEDARLRLKKLEDGLVDLQSYIVELERDLHSREIQAASIVQEIDRSDRHRKIVDDEIGQLKRELENTEIKRKDAVDSAASATKARSESGTKIEKTSLDLAEARKILDAENIAYNEIRTYAEVAAERMRSAVAALERVNAEKAELEARLTRQSEEIAATNERISELKRLTVELDERLALSENEIAAESDELSKALEHLKVAREGSDVTAAQLATLNNASADAREGRSAIEIKNAEINTRLQNVEANCLHDLGIELAELIDSIELEENFDFDEGKERVEYLRDRLENFGAINMLAVEELSVTEERLDFLTSQQKDIVDSIASAEEALHEIKRRSRDRFRTAFKVINENFTNFFSELFGGGKGEMMLMESDDILEAGIEIIAQPPGKRLQNMLLLSGGEKAMTAIALVLAIFKYKPSPFCLLDEVDAPLDDANVGRFVERIDAMSENTQFIVITHNKRTMEAARALYGVTMQEAGVSKVVSVRFD